MSNDGRKAVEIEAQIEGEPKVWSIGTRRKFIDDREIDEAPKRLPYNIYPRRYTRVSQLLIPTNYK